MCVRCVVLVCVVLVGVLYWYEAMCVVCGLACMGLLGVLCCLALRQLSFVLVCIGLVWGRSSYFRCWRVGMFVCCLCSVSFLLVVLSSVCLC